MEVIGTIEITDEPTSCSSKRFFREGDARAMPCEIQRESLLTIYVNDIPTMQVGCSASHLAELVCGRLFTEGLVRGIDEIDALSICENALRADVYLRDRTADLSRQAVRMVPTCCTNNVMFNDYFDTGTPLKAVTPLPWEPEWIFSLAEAFELDHTSHRRTHGTHSAYLAIGTDALYVREDIGRHNAFDKAIGSALIDEVDLTRCLLFTSGRVPTDMTAKAVRAGIPLLVSKAAPTDKTVEMAQSFGLTLICNATSRAFDVFSSPVEA